MTVVPLPVRQEPEPTAPSTQQQYTFAQGELIKQYQAYLASAGYAKLYNAASPYPRVISGAAPHEPLPMAWLSGDFADFCREQGKQPVRPAPSPDYLADRLQSVTGTIFLPKGPAIVRAKGTRHRYVNTYREFVPEHPPCKLSAHFLALLECMFPDHDERHTFTQYLAHMFQQPEVRPSWHPMLLSETGTGKGFLFNSILTPLLCKQTMLVKKYSELVGRFANAMDGTILVQLDDCKSGRADTQTQLKSLMTEERVLLEQKGLAAGMVTTYTRFILASNEEVPLNIDDTDRRWWIPKRLGYSQGLSGDEGRKERVRNVIQPLSDDLKHEGALEAIHDYFMRYPLDGFNPKSAPMTETLREQITKSITQEQVFTTDFLEEHATKVLKSGALGGAFSKNGLNKPSNKALSELLAYAGYRQELLDVNGHRTRWWFPVAMRRHEAEAILAAQEPQEPF
ncbi:primase-helicase family protein [Massilia sp. LjRoot122]|uniref:primase-helicase family protein n=1 Tax=Massilia sp. LjRoot122 TaxID=3342257 RepID=UPI003ECEF584